MKPLMPSLVSWAPVSSAVQCRPLWRALHWAARSSTLHGAVSMIPLLQWLPSSLASRSASVSINLPYTSLAKFYRHILYISSITNIWIRLLILFPLKKPQQCIYFLLFVFLNHGARNSKFCCIFIGISYLLNFNSPTYETGINQSMYYASQ